MTTSAFIDEFQIYLYGSSNGGILFLLFILIRAKMFNKINDANKTMKELEEEFMIKPKGVMDTLKQYF